MAGPVAPRREQPAFRVGAYLIFAMLLGVTLSALGLGDWVFPIYAAVGLMEVSVTVALMFRRRRAQRRPGPRAEWID